MQATCLTDNELRSLIDVQPDNLDAVREAARRFVEGSSQEAERIAQLEDELKQKDEDLQDAETRVDDIRDVKNAAFEQLDNLRIKLKELADA